MIAQYLIDWASIEARIDKAPDEAAMALRLRLTALRKGIEENGVVLVDDDSSLLQKLHDTIQRLSMFKDSSEEGFSQLALELECFQNVYENRRYLVKAPPSGAPMQSALSDCMRAWNEHARRISPQGIVGGVVIADENLPESDLGTLVAETIDSYGRSKTEERRRNWIRGQSFCEDSKKSFLEYLNAYAATTAGAILFVDPYWGAVGQTTEAGDESTQQQRYLNATKLFTDPFVRNPDVKEIEYLTVYPKDPDDHAKDCVCFATEGLRNLLTDLVATRKGDLEIKVSFVERKHRYGVFHNRFFVNKQYMVSLLNGMDVCDERGGIRRFEMQLFGESSRGNMIRRGSIDGYRSRNIADEEVDMVRPFEVLLHGNPCVRFKLNG